MHYGHLFPYSSPQVAVKLPSWPITHQAKPSENPPRAPPPHVFISDLSTVQLSTKTPIFFCHLSMLLLGSEMRLYYFPHAALWLSFCSIYVSAIHRMAQYPAFEEQVGLVDRQQLPCPESTETACPTGDVCCPSGAACYTSNGVPLCNEQCSAVAVTCTVNNILACCDVGQECSPSGCVSGSPGSGPIITGTTGSLGSTLTPPGGAASSSYGCGTNNPCYQGTTTWCCLPSLSCDFSSPGFCLGSTTSSQPLITTSKPHLTTSNVATSNVVVSLTTSHITVTGLAAPNVLDEGILMKIWAFFLAAVGVALCL